MIIQRDLEKAFEYIEPCPESMSTYSYRIHELIMRTCVEIEANFKAILNENKFTPKINRFGQAILNMEIYKKINVTHHLSSYEISLPIWNGPPRTIRPFKSWVCGDAPDWYAAYNASKHDRQDEFERANLNNLINAAAGLLVVIASRFYTQDFLSGGNAVSFGLDEYHDMNPAIGSLFRIKFPDDRTDDEKYEFNWSELKNESNRFEKINYDQI